MSARQPPADGSKIMTNRILDAIRHLAAVTLELALFVIVFNTLVHWLLRITK
jgi:hypothetical protein